MAETKQTIAATTDAIVTSQRTDPAIKVLIALAAAILVLLILAVTFTGGFFAGSYNGRKAATAAGIGKVQGMMGRQQNQQNGRGNLQQRMQQMGDGLARGEVTDVASDYVVVDDIRTGDKVTVKVTNDTTILKAGQTATLADISKGETIAAIGTLSGNTLTAKVIRIGAGGMRGGQGGMMGPGGPGF